MTEYEEEVIRLLSSINSKLSTIESDVSFLEGKVIEKADVERLIDKALAER